MNKIYTRTGDQGKTSLASGERVSKCCARLEAYGTIDELNSHLGLLLSLLSADDAERDFLTQIQRMLFSVGGNLATQPETGKPLSSRKCVAPTDIQAIEQRIDQILSDIPPMRAFILPGGTQAASQAHVCRTVCRRAERNILRLAEEGEYVDDQVTAYVNRLSDYFFTLSRLLNKQAGTEDIKW